MRAAGLSEELKTITGGDVCESENPRSSFEGMGS
jgi:hypothetical protein